ncbi:hypothetical protein MMC18_004473 [Xylographa bjoerkii]|nr:hypothetical protein [Xylographa bjoerkii]
MNVDEDVTMSFGNDATMSDTDDATMSDEDDGARSVDEDDPVQDPADTISYYLPQDELAAMTEYKTGEQAHLPNLQYPINPIFRQERWKAITNRQWALVEPVLRLASAFLESEASFIVLYSIVNAPQIPLPKSVLSYYDKYEIRRLDPSRHNPNARQEFSENLALFGDNLWWRVTNMQRRHKLADVFGKTQRQASNVLQYSNHTRTNITGNGSLISMTKRFWHMLELLDTSKSIPNTEIMRKTAIMTTNLHIHMAVTFCHEIAHMVHNASHQNLRSGEFFWENDAVAEYGRVWEQEVFGGTLRWQTPFVLEQVTYVVKWPDIFTIEWDTIGHSRTREMTKGSSTYYVMPLRWMVEVTSQRFWDQFFLSRSPRLLWVPKRLGLRMFKTTSGLSWWRMSQSSEGRNPADANRVVRRTWLSEIPSLNEPVQAISSPPAFRTRAKTIDKRKRSEDLDDFLTEFGRASKRKRGGGF